jgi:hypothetical protein
MSGDSRGLSTFVYPARVSGVWFGQWQRWRDTIALAKRGVSLALLQSRSQIQGTEVWGQSYLEGSQTDEELQREYLKTLVEG